MDVREKLEVIAHIGDHVSYKEDIGICYDSALAKVIEDAYMTLKNGVTVQEWISVKDHTPTEADGTVWVCLSDVFPYNEKEPYIDAKHDRRITEAHYSQFSKCWYKEGTVFPDGIVTHWMEKPQPPTTCHMTSEQQTRGE